MAFATILVHDPDPARARRIPGTIPAVLDGLGVEPRTASFVTAPDDVGDPADPELIVVMGSAEGAADDSVPWSRPELGYLRRAVEIGTPVLGICFGGQELSRVLGGTVGRGPRPERGFADVEVLDPAAVPAERWMQYHYDAFTLPPGARPLARNEVCLQGFAAGPHMGVQFHPEITTDVFAAWAEESAGSGGPPTPGHRARAEAIAAEIADRQPDSERTCRDLLAAFCERAATR